MITHLASGMRSSYLNQKNNEYMYMYETAHRAPSGDNLGRCRPKRSEADALRPSRNFLTLRIAPNSIVGRVQRQFSCFGTTSSLLLPLFTFCLSERSL